MRRDEHPLNRQAQPLLEGIAVLLHHRDQLDQVIDFLVGHGTPIGPPRQVGQDLPGARGVARALGRTVREDLLERFLGRALRLLVRPDDVEIHGEEGIDRPDGAAALGLRRASGPCRPAGSPSYIRSSVTDSQCSPAVIGVRNSAHRPLSSPAPRPASTLVGTGDLGLVDQLAVDPEAQLDRDRSRRAGRRAGCRGTCTRRRPRTAARRAGRWAGSCPSRRNRT